MTKSSPSKDNFKAKKTHTIETRIAIVAARWNSNITDNLVEGAQIVLRNAGVHKKNIDLFRVPGAFELPLACQKIAQKKSAVSVSNESKHTNTYDGIIALGCVIRGGTPHFDYICKETSRGLGEVALKNNIPVGFGLLTTDDSEQAVYRSYVKNPDTAISPLYSNKGKEAADAVLEMINLFRDL
tara:strand:+ start:524 stop:1075 length:552 start_codon:yes stop_codon:yes gene_type:complete